MTRRKTNRNLVFTKPKQMISKARYFNCAGAMLILSMFALSACQTIRSGNFNRQKFTNLQLISHKNDQPVELQSPGQQSDFAREDEQTVSNFLLPENDECTNSNCDTIITATRVIICTIKKVDDKEIMYSDCPQTSNLWVVPLSDVSYYSISPKEIVRKLPENDKQPGLDCDTIITDTRVIICTIKKVDDKEIMYSECPATSNLWVLQLSDVRYYTGGPNAMPAVLPGEEQPEVRDTLMQEAEVLPVYRPNDERYVRHKNLGRIYFLRALALLPFFLIAVLLSLTTSLAIIWGIAIFVIFFSFVVGYTFLAIAAYHSRIYKKLRPMKFAADQDAQTFYTLTILGMLLFGCFPFLIPFAIVWMIVKGESNKVIAGSQLNPTNIGSKEKKVNRFRIFTKLFLLISTIATAFSF